MAKRLTEKQQQAIALLTSGLGMSFKDIAEQIDTNPKTLWRWRNEPEFAHFQQELERINTQRWQAAVDAAREAAVKLCKAGNAKFVEFVLKNEGYNPTSKVEADLHTDIEINIEE